MKTVGIMQLMNLEKQLLGRGQTWYSVFKRDTRNAAEAYDFRCLRTSERAWFSCVREQDVERLLFGWMLYSSSVDEPWWEVNASVPWDVIEIILVQVIGSRFSNFVLWESEEQWIIKVDVRGANIIVRAWVGGLVAGQATRVSRFWEGQKGGGGGFRVRGLVLFQFGDLGRIQVFMEKDIALVWGPLSGSFQVFGFFIYVVCGVISRAKSISSGGEL